MIAIRTQPDMHAGSKKLESAKALEFFAAVVQAVNANPANPVSDMPCKLRAIHNRDWMPKLTRVRPPHRDEELTLRCTACGKPFTYTYTYKGGRHRNRCDQCVDSGFDGRCAHG